MTALGEIVAGLALTYGLIRAWNLVKQVIGS